mmetsp:Transcript_37698/g.97253  ORF Transcript_37698/g.97253 Transcript_37698/m.97253 type:complete len:258 (-) Transcript_37698:214-987(-)
MVREYDSEAVYNVRLHKSKKNANGLCIVVDTEEVPTSNTKGGGKRTRLGYLKGRVRVQGFDGVFNISFSCWLEKGRKSASVTEFPVTKGANTKAFFFDDRYLVVEIVDVHSPLPAEVGTTFSKDAEESLVNMTVIASTSGHYARKGELPIKFKLNATTTALKALSNVEKWRRGVVSVVEQWQSQNGGGDAIFPNLNADIKAIKGSIVEEMIAWNKRIHQERELQLDQQFVFPTADSIVHREESEEEYDDEDFDDDEY